MKCWYPKTLNAGIDVGCGKCPNCKINRVRMWIGRMVIEASDHPFSAFVTLTYNPENLPKDGSVCKGTLQRFIKRLRKTLHPRQIRYYAVGEYGDVSWRPHYHLIIFGLSPTEKEPVEKCWTLGYSMVGTAEPSSMSYVSSYVMKKLTNPKDLRLEGRKPEFCTMSLKPGIGTGLVARVQKALATTPGGIARQVTNDQFETIRSEKRMYPIGRLLKRKIANCIGTTEHQRSQNLWRSINELVAKEYEVGIDESAKRKSRAQRAAIALSKSKKTLTQRLL